MNPKQGILDFTDKILVDIERPIYFRREKVNSGIIFKLAIKKGKYLLSAIPDIKSEYILSYNDTLSFKAKIIRKPDVNEYKIAGNVTILSDEKSSLLTDVHIDGVGEFGGLRPAQVGAVYSLLSHWSLTNSVATIVLPTGTGKTETMLVATLADRAKKTLVIVPSIELKNQISEKFSTWGILRELGTINQEFQNPTVFVLNKILSSSKDIDDIKTADVVVSTPALIARTDGDIKKLLKNLFSHVYFDEAHHIMATEWNAIKVLFKDSKIVQFTATPYRNDKQPIEGKIVYNYPMSKALDDGCFSKISLISIDEKHPAKKDKAIAYAAIQKLNEDRERGWTRHKVMVRTETREHAEQLYVKYKEWFPNESIVLVHSGIKGKTQLIQQIKEGKYSIIICVDMLKEGFDYPDFKIAAVHDIHKSLSVLLQFIGRFTRTQKGLGEASFVVNYADEDISIELENLFQEGVGWENLISDIADAKKREAESLLTFLQGCKPYTGFDSPDVELNPKLVYPALSFVCFRTDAVDWSKFNTAFDLKRYSLSQPFVNTTENIFYFTTQKREKVKWAKNNKMRDQKWDLIAIYYDTSSKLLYVCYTEKRFDVDLLVAAITNNAAQRIMGDDVFRSFHSIKRLSILKAGIFKPANHLHRYSSLIGADVTTELTRWKAGKRYQKSDFIGVGYREGEPVSVGASVKGKVWSPARVGNLKEWKNWCVNMGKLITDTSINSDELLADSASKKEITNFPEGLVVLATDWSESLYDRLHKITIGESPEKSLLLSECELKTISCKDTKAEFKLLFFDKEINFSMILGGERGFEILGLDECNIMIEGLYSSGISLKKFFEVNPPTMFLLNGATISGCIHTDYGEEPIIQIPADRIEILDWTDVDYKTESLYKGITRREHSIQEYIMNKLSERGATIIFNDDNSGESADVIGIFVDEENVLFEMVHCKYSEQIAGARISDLYEVAGQAIVSLRYKWNPEELIKHIEYRNATGILKGLRFYKGGIADLKEIKKALTYKNVQFEFAIAQPGVSTEKLSNDMKNFLGSVYSTVIDMTETKLKCYFSK
ncbi:MAG: DEAD/DEAH box helicase family protein [Alphaproteobacteria bacterium]|nr:DEAD/DEAH box helicase family protein [Alphaproteobacteria bacterium]